MQIGKNLLKLEKYFVKSCTITFTIMMHHESSEFTKFYVSKSACIVGNTASLQFDEIVPKFFLFLLKDIHFDGKVAKIGIFLQ